MSNMNAYFKITMLSIIISLTGKNFSQVSYTNNKLEFINTPAVYRNASIRVDTKNNDDSTDQSFFLGIALHHFGFNAKFTRSKVDGEFDAKFQSAIGMGAVLGVNYKLLGLDVNYMRVSSDMNFTNANKVKVSGKVSCNALNSDFKLFLIRESLVQPFLLAGIGIIWLTPDDKEVFGATPLWDDTFTMLNLDLGLGANLFLASNISLTGNMVYVLFGGFSSVGSLSGSHPVITYDMNGSCINFNLSARLYF